MRRLGVVLAIGLALVSPRKAEAAPAPASSSSDSTSKRTASLRAEAEARLNEQDVAGAQEKLRAAWALAEEGETASLMGECEERKGHLARAAQHFATATSLLPAGPAQDAAHARLEALRPRVGGLRVATNVPGAIIVVGSFAAEAPVQEIFVEPGEVVILVKKPGYREVAQKVSVAAGKSEGVGITLKPEKQEFEGLAAESPRSMVPAYVMGGVGLASLGTGVLLRVLGVSAGDEADTKLAALSGSAPCAVASPPADCESIKNLRVQHDNYVNMSTGLFVVGGVSILGAVVYAAIAAPKNKQPGVAFLPVVSPTSAGAWLSGSF